MLFGGVAGDVGRLVVLSATVSWLLLNSWLCRTSRLNIGD